MQGPRILHCCGAFVVANKPPGWLSQSNGSGQACVLDWVRRWLRVTFKNKGEAFCAGLHRLDQPVSGAMVFARTSKAARRLASALQARQGFHRTYYCIVHHDGNAGSPSMPPSGIAKGRILCGEGRGAISKMLSYEDEEESDKFGGKYAELSWRLLASGKNYGLLRVQPKTGRKHQIRAQLRSLKQAILGDVKYGSSFPLPDRSIALHCGVVSVLHPTQHTWIHVRAPYPPLWKKLLPQDVLAQIDVDLERLSVSPVVEQELLLSSESIEH